MAKALGSIGVKNRQGKRSCACQGVRGYSVYNNARGFALKAAGLTPAAFLGLMQNMAEYAGVNHHID